MSEPVDVRLLTLEQVLADADQARAFSNGYEGDCWTSRWCESCKHDEFMGGGTEDGVTNCPIADAMVIEGVTPRELEEVGMGGLENRYRCLGYEPADDGRDARQGLPQ